MSLLWTGAAWTEPDEIHATKYGQKPEHLYGNVHHADEYFGGSPTRPVPWRQQSRSKHLHDYDKAKVRECLTNPEHPIEDADPRTLKASQPSVVRAAAQHYLTGEHEKTGDTFGDKGNLGNKTPVVYEHENGDRVILSGHHRALKALFHGHPLRARVVRGGRPPR